METIHLETIIDADIKICFDLSRSIDLHQISTAKTNEKAIAGITSGLVNVNDYVTWEAVHFGIKQQLTSKISKVEPYIHFRDEQLKGAFKYFVHDHYFKEQNGKVIMTDRFEFSSPFGIMGKLFDKLILKNYMKLFLLERNRVIKEFAETDKWKKVLNS
ncbi:MAG: cell division protein [Sphingobacteriaceae bacterium]|nr:cell division protein [Sphingobacteriaceae bacterium]